jgi:hypothetical protein
MTPSETIRLQALKLKSTIDGNHQRLIDSLLNDPANKAEVEKEFRNVCALIHNSQFQKLEGICSLLDLTKREVIQMALSEFLQKADEIVHDVNPFESQEQAQEEANEHDYSRALDSNE